MTGARSRPMGTVVAIVGAESTGKTELARALCARLAADTGRRVACVPEVLREWCEQTGRTPQSHEQAAIVRAQHERIDAAAASHDIVVCDTTALMTAVYSGLLFDDHSLDERAAQLHGRRVTATLLTALDLPWVADGLQRDGPHVRGPVDDALRALMHRHGIAYSVVGGGGPDRLDNALAALRPVFEEPPAERPAGLFTRLAGAPGGGAGWACECCQPGADRALRRLRGA
jgi:nicotinamide riboside kinase